MAPILALQKQMGEIEEEIDTLSAPWTIAIQVAPPVKLICLPLPSL
jgi:hypothetical protein